jgi:ATP-dependent DNA ligase
MSMFPKYDQFKYIYPPRPPQAGIKPAHLGSIGNEWIAQPKYNGSCGVLFINGFKEYRLCNRTAGKLSCQKPLNYTALNDSKKFMVLCGEYLNKSQKGEDGKPFNHKFIIWDILVHKGFYLIGETFQNRLNILHELFGTSSAQVTDQGIGMFDYLHTTKVENVYMAPTYVNHLKQLYDDIIKTDLYEGLVLKRATGKLQHGFIQRNNTDWQLKVKKKT